MPDPARLPTMLFNVNDWMTSKAVAMMTYEQQGMYFKLLCYAWLNDDPGTIESDPAAMAALLHVSEEEWGRHSAAIGRAWDTTSREGAWTHPRMIEERERQLKYIEQQRRQGAMGAAKRWTPKDNPPPSRRHSGGIANDSGVGVGVGDSRDSLPLPSQPEPEPEPPASRVPPSGAGRESSASPQENPNGHSPDKADPDDLTPAEFFDQHFWPNYPRRKGRASARREWLRAVGVKGGDARLANRIVDALLSVSRGDWRDREEKFIPYAHTWLSNRGWEDS